MFLWLVLVALFALYWAPTYLAWELQCQHFWHVALVNLLVGWTFIGWVVAAVMAWRDRPIPPNRYVRLGRRSQGLRAPEDP